MTNISQTPAHAAATTAVDVDAPAFWTEAKILTAILAVLSIWAVAFATFGVPALLWPMKVIVPACFLMLIIITQGK